MHYEPSHKIYLAESKILNAGRGIFAAIEIKQGKVIEECPIILVPDYQTHHLRDTELHNYYFMWRGDEAKHEAAICLGFGSLYNHSYNPNATYKKLIDRDMIHFVALRDIAKDEEITVNYNYGNPDDKSKLWIDSIPTAE